MIGVILYFVMICESYCSRTYAYLDNIENADASEQVVNQTRMAAPQIHFRMQNYHYETRVTYHNNQTQVE